MSPAGPENNEIELLYQKYPRKGNKRSARSKTDSFKSYQLDALHEYGKLKVNGTIPNHIIQLNYNTVLSKGAIQELWRKHSRRLRKAGIVARVAIEITRDKWRQRPINKVHYHFVVKDDRTPDELEELFEAVCCREMDRSTFKVHVFPFKEELGGWLGYIAYFVKLRNKDKKPILLKKRGLRKYYTINEELWWTYPDGTPRTIGSIKEQMQQYKIAKKQLKQTERLFEVKKHQPAGKEKPTNFAKLIEVLKNETDETLYDWFAILLGLPTVFGTEPPEWLLDHIHRKPQKRIDLLNALYAVISETDSPLIALAYEIYIGCKME